jgi:coiled-coil-helix-coiled-coil-helix domain-containing protein 2
MLAANAAKVAAPPPPPKPHAGAPPGEPSPQPLLQQDKQDELHQNERSDNVRAGEGLLPVGDGEPARPAPGRAAAPAPAAPAPADRPAAAAAPGAAAPGAAAAEGDIVHAEESGEGEGFDNNEQEGEYPPDEAMAAAEARAKAAEDRAEAAAARAEAAEREAAAAANRAEAAESRAAKAEANLALIEQEATGTCDLIAKLEKEVKELRKQVEKKNPVTSGSTSLSPKPTAEPRHSAQPAAKRPKSSHEPPAAKQAKPSAKPPAPPRPSKSPRQAANLAAAANERVCYFQGRELPSGEGYICHRPLTKASLRSCAGPKCLHGPGGTPAFFHLWCFHNYYEETELTLPGDLEPFHCPECEDPRARQ